jgi:hypothetical protein
MMVVVVMMMMMMMREIVAILCTSGHRLKVVFILPLDGFASSNFFRHFREIAYLKGLLETHFVFLPCWKLPLNCDYAKRSSREKIKNRSL